MKKSKPEKPVDVSVYTELYTHLLHDFAAVCSVRHSSVLMDQKFIKTRSESEGIGFFTKSLPLLGKALDRALAKGESLTCVPSFPWDKESNCPLFMGSFFKLIFGPDGTVLDYPYDVVEHMRQVEAVRAVRQVAYLLYKLELPYTTAETEQTLTKFVEVDASLPEREQNVALSFEALRSLDSAQMLLWYALEGLNLQDIVPGHGPGAVATGEKAYEKMNFQRLYRSLDEKYPYGDYFFFNYTHLCDHLELLEGMVEHQSGTAKVVLVPKDSRGPRLISMEPLELQWIQQGQLKALVKHIEKHWLTKGHVNFTCQDINRELARLASFPGNHEIVTLDMKDASDRVSDWLVTRIFPKHVVDYLHASRSESTLLPNGVSVKLKKFAPMGSAVCFPVEALTFWALAVGAVRRIRRRGDLQNLPDVYVYGDDIICDLTDYARFRPVFEELFLEFNETKCCTSRFFRESCGLDAFKQSRVEPIRVKHLWSKEMSPQQLLSYISYINSLGDRHLRKSREYLITLVEAQTGPLPRIRHRDRISIGIVERGWDDAKLKAYNLKMFKCRYNRHLQRQEIRLRLPHSRTCVRGEPGWDQILRILPTGYSDEPDRCSVRLEPCCYTVPHRLKWGWSWVPLTGVL